MPKWKFKFELNSDGIRETGTRVPTRESHTRPRYINTLIVYSDRPTDRTMKLWHWKSHWKSRVTLKNLGTKEMSNAKNFSVWFQCPWTRVRIRLKILYSNFLFIHHEAEVGIWFYIVKTAIQSEICVAKCLKCGASCSAIQSNSHPALNNKGKYCSEIIVDYHCDFLCKCFSVWFPIFSGSQKFSVWFSVS